MGGGVVAELAPVITVDGPAAAGKGAAARALAQHLGFHYLDSGKIYRAVALAAGGADDPDSVRHAAANVAQMPPEEIFLQPGLDLPETGAAASRLAAFSAVREVLLPLQRRFRRFPGLVADGRDMGTVVFPDAELKVFLTADAEIRAARRLKQLQEKKIHATITSVLADIQQRDEQDCGRAGAPLAVAPGAVAVDSSHLAVSGIVLKLAALFAALTKKETSFS